MLIEYSNKIRITEWIRILIRTPPDNLTDLDFISSNIRTDYYIFCVLEIVTDFRTDKNLSQKFRENGKRT